MYAACIKLAENMLGFCSNVWFRNKPSSPSESFLFDESTGCFVSFAASLKTKTNRFEEMLKAIWKTDDASHAREIRTILKMNRALVKEPGLLHASYLMAKTWTYCFISWEKCSQNFSEYESKTGKTIDRPIIGRLWWFINIDFLRSLWIDKGFPKESPKLRWPVYSKQEAYVVGSWLDVGRFRFVETRMFMLCVFSNMFGVTISENNHWEPAAELTVNCRKWKLDRPPNIKILMLKTLMFFGSEN